MATSSILIGRVGQAYAKKQAAWGTFEPLVAANAFRHKALTFPGSDNKNYRLILEKKVSPFPTVGMQTAQRGTAGYNLSALLRPSGTINTLPEVDPFLECAFGAKTNTVLATTVASGSAVGGATLTSAAGLAVGGALLIVCPDAKKRVRFITAVDTGTGVTTWAPNLPASQNPAVGAAVKSGLTYKPTSQLLLFFTIAHYLKNLDATAALARQIDSASVEKLTLAFDANDDPMLTLSGLGRYLDTPTAQAQPAGFTMVGTQPPSGLTGEFLIDNTATKFMKLSLDLNNALKVRADSYGQDKAEEVFRVGRPVISVGLDVRAESETLYDLTEAGTNCGVFLQTGFTEGNIIAVRLPSVSFTVPDTDDPDEEVNFPFKGEARESTDAALDIFSLALC